MTEMGFPGFKTVAQGLSPAFAAPKGYATRGFETGSRVMAIAAAVMVLTTVHVRSDDPVSSSVRYTGEIVRIFDRKCLPCHSDNSLAVPLASYRQVRDWGRAIREEIVDQRMPPWSAARGYQRLRNELSLTAREAATVMTWLDGGMPRGDDRDLPRAPTPAPGDPPDLHLALPAQQVPAREEHVVRRVSIDIGLDADRVVARFVVKPGVRRVLRGALLFASNGQGENQWVGAWQPWQPDVAPPSPYGFLLPARARLTVELHYRGGERDVLDQPSVDVYLVPTARGLTELGITAGSPARVDATSALWAIVPLGDAATTSLEVTARKPDGTVNVLLWIPEYRREWPQTLVFDDPVALPVGTTVTLVAEPQTSAAMARLSLLPARAASNATRSPTRTPARPRK